MSSASRSLPAQEMELQQPAMVDDDPSTFAASIWEWGDLLDFDVDDRLLVSLDSDQPPAAAAPPPRHPTESELYPSPGSGEDRVRKRDPRLTCSNFLEGRIPCSCPEIDQRLEDREFPTKKRVRSGGRGVARCQVPGCEADISELKGYHRRHRVCLRCANASSVVLDGESKRYCQQCGKFHVLSDFDEGKRSCRRKLERHNNRRKRKPVDNGGGSKKQQQANMQNENSVIDVDDGKDNICSINQIAEQEASLDFEDQHFSAQGAVPVVQSINTDSFVSFADQGGAQTVEGKNEKKIEHSPSYGDNRSAYSSECPTGRISFKLYDWNPAEFPRRLRHQIFQWLSTMPVELESYIRPGCTILTVFIAMPEVMWAKLSKDPVAYLDEFILKPGKMLFGRGSMTVYLNNMIFGLMRGGNSVKSVNVKIQAPRLQFVYPTCFEAGKPIELVICGRNLLQPKFRFLVSFCGKYLPYNYSVISPPNQDGKSSPCCCNKLYKINVVNSDPNLFGPAFVEVENESGLSNFIPLIIGDEAICSEMKLIEQKLNATLFPDGQVSACCSFMCFCGDFEQRQTAFSGLLLDIAWSVKVPISECTEQNMNLCQIRRYNRVLDYLIQSNSASILAKVLQNMEILVNKMEPDSVIHCTSERDVRLLHENMNLARDNFRKCSSHEQSTTNSGNIPPSSNRSCGCGCGWGCGSGCGCGCQSSFQKETPSRILTIINQDSEAVRDSKQGMKPVVRKETDPLLSKEFVMNVDGVREWPVKSCSSASHAFRARPTAFVVTTFVVCLALCAVLYHPSKVTALAVAIRTRLAH
ncbi:PREDICTED: squamosa promoter-binding-like protein 7 isoform X2 [Tarenaya hassleriana]|uniref:squamosa promoter-binding-like protein 7 isoform X2 n=1 Tax=Tarenaya hassleriana TaxID=28532 RepID=UPI00053C1FB0|nr:PREDICTED: squamosa promoter-binding-like protein 7 isoform X2 [Tarenaya hassleriana]